MVPAQGVGGQIRVLLDLDIVLLDVHGRQGQEGDLPQTGENVVVNDLLIAVHRGLRPGGADDVVHPALQPFPQSQVVLGGVELLLPVDQEVPQARPGGVEGAVGLVALEALALLVPAQVHADVIDLPALVIGNIALHCLSCHNSTSMFFLCG